MSQVAERLVPFGESIFSTMSRLAVEHGAVNLSQGFPDFDGPDWLKQAAIQAIQSGPNQYAPSPGNPLLRQKLSQKMQRESGLVYQPDSEITVCSGATEGIAAVLLGLLNPGDEVILFEPFYDSYPACVALAGAVARYLPLQLPDFSVDWAALEAMINPKTRAILVNTPGNPCGKVFSEEELAQLAALAQRHPDLLFITDEVYEHIVFSPARHATLAAQPGMRERTLVISSFSKTLSMTGWKVGYVFAPAPLTAAVRASHQFLTFCSVSPLQAALAEIMDRLPDYVGELSQEYLQRRDLWCSLLDEARIPYRVPQGSYFVISDVRDLGHEDDVQFCRWITENLGVAAIPASAFYQTPGAGKGLVRWAFCKGFDTLREAGRRLLPLRKS
ncbi:aminotransferase class I/II-fold pyridoxal phosphate-dependent enzyme [bacterium]|nr:aminotransferase class I/II-fold pyridoxal phosphate-dependent enzyme [bacterium]